MDYGAQETAELQELFRPAAQRHRRRRRIALLAGGAAVGLLVGILLWNGVSMLVFNKPIFRGNLPWYVNVVIVAFFLISLAALISLPRLRCPLCGGFIDKGVGRYCPECGADGLDTDLFGRPRCRACGKTMLRGRHGVRRYKVRACTSCGLLLDPEGI